MKRQMAIEGKAELALVDAEVVTGGRRRLGPVSLAFGVGALHGIIGHNGSGKSTLLKLLARQAVPTSGAVTLAGEAVARLAPRAFARRIAYLAQALPGATGLTVRELVAQGSLPVARGARPGHGPPIAQPSRRRWTRPGSAPSSTAASTRSRAASGSAPGSPC